MCCAIRLYLCIAERKHIRLVYSKSMKIVYLIYLLLFSIGNAHAGNWEIVRKGRWDTNFHGIYFLNENVGWAVGSRSVIAHTEDGGRTWTKQDANIDKIYTLKEVCFTDVKKG
ncbi:MAG: WD40/YVTN/BNR-like repeat-containing protein [Candidatus Poribacteria bacterium]